MNVNTRASKKDEDLNTKDPIAPYLSKALPAKWVYPEFDQETIDFITKEFHLHPTTARILHSRGITTKKQIHDFLYAQLPDLHDPYLFADIEKSILRIEHAIENSENILICGDNDVDGMTGTALLTEFLRMIGGSVFFYTPNRNELKRSIILDAVEYAREEKCKLLITVDCGITAAQDLQEAAEFNIDVIITDHHEPTHKIPHCLATLNPKLFDSNYPNRDLTGVGVAFKLIHGLTVYLVSKGKLEPSTIDLKSFLDLAALGTIADMGALLGENRILVRYGLKQLEKKERVGLAKLLSVCELDLRELVSSDIASKIAPRLNSLGRIADPKKGIELLLIKDPVEAEIIAKELDLNNIERQKIERQVNTDVEKILETTPEILKEKALIMDSDRWHPGVIAIVATRCAKQYNRPSVIIASDGKTGKGSMRSIREFPLLPSLKKLSHLLTNFGGHDYAAGLTIPVENIETFKKEFISIANEQLEEHDVQNKIYLDAPVDFEQITFNFMESLNLLEPHGNENPAPILYCTATQAWPPKVVGKTHLKFYLEQKGRLLEGIGFGMGHLKSKLRRKGLELRIAFTPQINEFLNKASIQLIIRDIQIIE
jgi:single-stranded-DNA-specific exonuclease